MLLRPFIIAGAFIRIPRLFVYLLLWPMLIGLLVLAVQLAVTIGLLGVLDAESKEVERRLNEDQSSSWLRKILFDTRKPLAQLAVCRWTMQDGKETPPSEECAVKKTDVFIRVADPQLFEAAELEKAFKGATHHLHLCRSCSGDLLMDMTAKREMIVRTPSALAVLMLAEDQGSRERSRHLVDSIREREAMKQLTGTIYFSPPGAAEPLNLSELHKVMVLITNIALLIIIAIWLALKAHRKVLDYFARNEALLPLVAGCGKLNFYLALWVITLLRVLAFLLAAVPAIVVAMHFSFKQPLTTVLSLSYGELLLWLAAIATGLAALAIVASIGELKQRYLWYSFLYQWLPFLATMCGAAIWVGALFYESKLVFVVQQIVAALPIVGIAPVLLTPAFRAEPDVLAFHFIASLLLVAFALRSNSRWFAAHLEEI